MTTDQRHYVPYLLYRTRGIGPKRTFDIIRHLNTQGRRLEELAVEEVPSILQLFPSWGTEAACSFSSLNLDQLEKELVQLEAAGVSLVSLDASDYPHRLVERLGSKAPTLLFLKGNRRLAVERGIAIVGSRAASSEALLIAGQLAGDLALNGFNVISGYAGGIDTAAHRGALEQSGTTTIVLSQGILGFRKKQALQDVFRRDDILAVSQFLPNEAWSGRNAMARNVLVCALAEAVVVIESGTHSPGKMSGTFDAGEQAIRLNVPLFVVDAKFLPNGPGGNEALVKLGAISCSPFEIVQGILEHANVRSTPTAGQQLSMSL